MAFWEFRKKQHMPLRPMVVEGSQTIVKDTDRSFWYYDIYDARADICIMLKFMAEKSLEE